MPVPTLDPHHRDVTVTSPADGYRSGARVWVYRSGSWRPGVVLQSSPRAATVRYRPAEGLGTAVDTVTGFSLLARHEDDRYLDEPGVDA